MPSKKIVLHFPPQVVDQPVVYELIKKYNLVVNILKASISPRKEGLIVIEVTGDDIDYNTGLEYLHQLGLTVQPLSQDIKWNNEVCIHCGACTAVCPTQALYVTRPTMEVSFDEGKCVGCEICVKACPVHAMEVQF